MCEKPCIILSPVCGLEQSIENSISVNVFFSCLACPEQAKNLACEILNSPNVMAFEAHPSGQHDNAYPKTNLQDMCAGRKAHNSQ